MFMLLNAKHGPFGGHFYGIIILMASGLKVSDLLNLGWRNCFNQKGRSFCIVIAIAVLFSVVLGFNTVLNGLEMVLAQAASENGGGRFYVATGFEPETFSCKQDIKERCILTPVPEHSDEIIQRRLERYHGRVIGRVAKRDFSWWEEKYDLQTGKTVYEEHNEQYYVIDASVVLHMGFSLGDVPKGRLPVLLPQKGDMANVAESGFYNVGYYPVTESDRPSLPGSFNILNFALDTVRGSDRNVFLIDDDSGNIEKFFGIMDGETDAQGHEEVYEVAVFTDVHDALTYYERALLEGPEFGYDFMAKYLYVIKDIFGNVINIASAFTRIKMILWLIAGLILVIAVCVATLTFVHVIGDDAKIISLYRSMGASKRDILLIYFVYLFLLCLLAVLLCVIITIGLVVFVTLMNGSSLALRLQQFYYLQSRPRVVLIGGDWLSLVVIALILLVAPIALLLSMKAFSDKNLAKRLKE